jgi:hypothetical protein
MKKAVEIINKIFGWGIYICLFAGGLTFFGFLLALIIGGGDGGAGQAIASFLQKQFFPVIIRIASIIIILGLVGMYLNGDQALSMKTDKEDADKDIALSKKLNK